MSLVEILDNETSKNVKMAKWQNGKMAKMAKMSHLISTHMIDSKCIPFVQD
jgi:hypothetical protein